MSDIKKFSNLSEISLFLRDTLENKNCIVLYAYNGTGKTRLSMDFKDEGKKHGNRDTLYFNAFTEDLFSWDNDLTNDTDRKLKLNSYSRFFDGLKDIEMETKIRPFLQRYANFDFTIHYETSTVIFSYPNTNDFIKISRGEENIFKWCFFLAIVQLVLDDAIAYNWVKYIYIDDPISSLDDNNAIAIGCDLVRILHDSSKNIKVIISSHHALFFNVMYNSFDAGKSKKTAAYFLAQNKESNEYSLRQTNATPFYHHVALLAELKKAATSGKLYTYHFNILRTLLEKSASFHGYANFSACLPSNADDSDGVLHARLLNILSHGNYSLYEPQEMLAENKEHFKNILNSFLERYSFNEKIFEKLEEVSP